MSTKQIDDLTVVVTTIPPRAHLLPRALASIDAQTAQPAEVIVELDSTHAGASITKTQGLNKVKTQYVAFLDDDDYFRSTHLEILYNQILSTNSDVVYCAPLVLNAYEQIIPLQEEWGRYQLEFDENALRDHSFIGMFSMFNADLAKSVGGFVRPNPSQYDDWDFFLAMLDSGAKFKHVPVQTYVWNHVPNIHNSGIGNTSGKADRWK